MTREVLVRVCGLHTVDGVEDDVEVLCAGRYAYRNGKHYVEYEEIEEDGSCTGTTVGGYKVRTRLTLRGKRLEVLRRGDGETRMVFEEGQTHVCGYRTVIGVLPVGFCVHKMDVLETEEELDVRVEYGLELDGEYLADSRLRIWIASKKEQPA